ncbi:ASCH domain-containing protein [Actinomadura litoris]|uniref:ASCH domain-containing protein n=1 Tax=Actinomadura litoris TaxID=2678616 RepID=A0A7K1LBB1_9ACTN|nr:ASCH domain-containing protein [Actinomadura litoris]MUN41475.1 ASCH domain-containing protein [Actinomadura litoris]
MPELTPPDELRGLTIHQPWANAIASNEKRIENRAWRYAPTYCGWVAIHAGAATATQYAVERVAEITGTPVDVVMQRSRARSVILAVARLAAVCSESAGATELVCGCGPWAMPGQRHFRLADVRPIPSPVPCKGALGLWRLPSHVDAAVRAQLGERVA